MRYLIPRLREDLQKKMVLLAGPRQCGKTTLAKSLLNSRGEYLNWDLHHEYFWAPAGAH
jgi:predicted AAA+ superfamily ATPase